MKTINKYFRSITAVHVLSIMGVLVSLAISGVHFVSMFSPFETLSLFGDPFYAGTAFLCLAAIFANIPYLEIEERKREAYVTIHVATFGFLFFIAMAHIMV